MLYSQGVPLEALGIPAARRRPGGDGSPQDLADFRRSLHLFRGTPSGVWLAHELHEVFGVQQKLSGATAQAIYDELADKLARPEYRPRALFERFKIEVLCTTDAASDSLAWHQAIKDSGWPGVVRPTFRPDAVVNLETVGWRAQLDAAEPGLRPCDHLGRRLGHSAGGTARFLQSDGRHGYRSRRR